MRWVAVSSVLSLLVLAGLSVWEGWALQEASAEHWRRARVLRGLAQVQRAAWAAVDAAKAGDLARLQVNESTAGKILNEVLALAGPSPEAKELQRAWGAFRQALRSKKDLEPRFFQLVSAAEGLADRVVSQETGGGGAFFVVLGVVLFTLALWAFTAYFLALKPSRELAREAQRLALGDLDEPIKVRAWGSLRRAADSLERLRQNLLELRKQIRRMVGGAR